MQPHSSDYLRLLAGSAQQTVTANAWRGGQCVKQGLQIQDGSLTITAGQAVRASLQLTIVDPTGELKPRADGPLSPFGSEIELRAGMKRGTLRDVFPLGWYRIGSAAPAQRYREYRSDIDSTPKVVSNGAVIPINAVDRAVLVQRNLILVAAQPSKPTVLQEIAFLLRNTVPWQAPAIADRPLSASQVTYDGDRLKAVTDLADLLDADLIFTPAGVATLAVRNPPLVGAWSLPRGQFGVVGSLETEMSSDDVHNAVLVRSTDFGGVPIHAVAADYTPGIEWGGPYGRFPLVIDSPLAGTVADALRMATNELALEQRRRWQVVKVQAACNYALEVGVDPVELVMPRGKIVGHTIAATWPLKPGLMSIDVAVDPFVLAKVL